MRWFTRPFRARHLIASWIIYWVILGALTLPALIAAILKATNAPPDQASVSIGFNNTVLSIIVTLKGQPIYAGSASILTMTLAIAGPPLVLFFLWVTQARRQESAREAVM